MDTERTVGTVMVVDDQSTGRAILEQVIKTLAHVAIRTEEPESYALPSRALRRRSVLVGPDGEAVQGGDPGAASAAVDPNDPSTWGRLSRNATCPCGSGKKYKHCHGRV